MLLVLCFLICYLLGNVHPSILISKFAFQKDVRDYGSGNAGATNMMRTFGLTYGAMVFALDAIKGALGFLIGYWIGGAWGACIGSIAVVMGHDWPIIYKFKGGKGIACCVGIMVVTSPYMALITLVCAVVVILLTKYVSAGSLIGAVVFTMTALFTLEWPYKVMAIALMILAYLRHIQNIKRLAADVEPRFSIKK